MATAPIKVRVDLELRATTGFINVEALEDESQRCRKKVTLELIRNDRNEARDQEWLTTVVDEVEPALSAAAVEMEVIYHDDPTIFYQYSGDAKATWSGTDQRSAAACIVLMAFNMRLEYGSRLGKEMEHEARRIAGLFHALKELTKPEPDSVEPGQ